MTRTLLRVSLLALAASAIVGCEGENIGANVDEVRGRRGAGADSARGGVLATRALVNRDGTADFEATTGALDSESPPPGSLDTLALTLYDNAGSTPLSSQTFSARGSGYFTQRLPGVRRGQSYEVDALVAPTAGAAMSWATVRGLARLRPDLAWEGIIGPERPGIIGPERVGIIGPERATLNNAVRISSRLIERNLDVGAVADCVLSVDGAVVETVQQIALMPGGRATCVFRYQFTTAGRHQVTLGLVNVKPGDYDNANNFITDYINIIGPERGR